MNAIIRVGLKYFENENLEDSSLLNTSISENSISFTEEIKEQLKNQDFKIEAIANKVEANQTEFSKWRNFITGEMLTRISNLETLVERLSTESTSNIKFG